MSETVTAPPAAAGGEGSARIGRGLRIARGFGWALIWLGGLTLGFVAHQLWITTWLSQLNQSDLDVEREAHFASAEITEVEYVPPGSTPPTTGSVPGATVPPPGGGDGGSAQVTRPAGAPLVLKVESAPEEHSAFARIRIPTLERLREGWNVVEGVKRSDLKNGAGHMPWTPLPGQPGNSVISGHRTTYGAPFQELDELVPGDRIEIDTALGTHVYAVTESIIVEPTALWVTEPRDGAWLTLTTCNPMFSARQRLVVFAELVAGPNAAVFRRAS